MIATSIKNRFQKYQRRGVFQDKFLLAWIFCALLVVAIPGFKWHSYRSRWYNLVGHHVEYDKEMAQQEQMEEEGAENDEVNYDYYYRKCQWLDLECRVKQYRFATQAAQGDASNLDENTVFLPNWFIYLGGETDDMRQWESINEGEDVPSYRYATFGEYFVYVWTLFMFLTMAYFGAQSLYNKGPSSHMIIMLILFLQVPFITLVFCFQRDVIATDDEVLRESLYGWYGQPAVLLATTSMWYISFCVAFVLAFAVRIYLQSTDEHGGNSYKAGVVTTGYGKYAEPTLPTTQVNEEPNNVA